MFLLKFDEVTKPWLLVLPAVTSLVLGPLLLMPLLRILAHLEEARTELRRLTSIDFLTGAATRAAFMERATAEWARALRYETPLSVVMLDVDHFKRLNDQHGHAFGDLALQAITKAVSAAIRETDLLARHGGEEFVLLLPMTDVHGAAITAQRVVEAVRAIRLVSPELKVVPLTISAGVSTRSEQLQSLAGAIEVADVALYSAKAAGRDCVRIGAALIDRHPAGSASLVVPAV